MPTAAPDADGELLVLQHHALTPPAGLGELLDSRAGRRPWRLVDLGGRDPVPQLDGIGGLLVLGGPMGVGDARAHAWMDDELELLAATVAAELPVFGVCLGAQLLAAALGGQVVARETPQIAFTPLVRTGVGGDDEIFAGWPDDTAALLFHQDQVELLPDGAEPMLGGGDGIPAWRAGSAYAVQFHPEIDPALLASWLEQPLFQQELARADVDGDALLEECDRREPFLRATGLSLVGRWLDGVVA